MDQVAVSLLGIAGGEWGTDATSPGSDGTPPNRATHDGACVSGVDSMSTPGRRPRIRRVRWGAHRGRVAGDRQLIAVEPPGTALGRGAGAGSAEPLKVSPPSDPTSTVTVVALGELAGEDPSRQGILELPLERPPQRPRPVDRVVALPREVAERGIGHFQVHAGLGQPALHAGGQQSDDLAQLRLVERPEDDDLVDAVEELRPEVLAELEPDVLGGALERVGPGLGRLDERRSSRCCWS